jgi:transposase
MAYPVKMRERALQVLRKGHSKKEVNAMFGLGINTLKTWEKLEQETGSLENRPLNRKPRKIDRDALRKYCEENPFATHREAAVFFNCEETGIRHAKKALGITRKKDNTIHGAKRKRTRRLCSSGKQLA